MTAYLAIARLTVGGDERTHNRELSDGMNQLVSEMTERGWDADRINRAFESACGPHGIKADNDRLREFVEDIATPSVDDDMPLDLQRKALSVLGREIVPSNARRLWERKPHFRIRSAEASMPGSAADDA